MTPTQIQAVQRSFARLAPSDSVAAALLHTLAQALKAGAREWALKAGAREWALA